MASAHDSVQRISVTSANYIIGWGIVLAGAPLVALVGCYASAVAEIFWQAALWLAVIGILMLLLTSWQHETAADVIVLVSGWFLYLYLCYREGGLTSPAVLGFAVLALLALYVRGPSWGAVTTLFGVLGVFLVAYLETRGLLPADPYESAPLLKAAEYMTYFVSLGLLQVILNGNRGRLQWRVAREAAERRAAERRLSDAIHHAPYATLVCELTEDGQNLTIVSVSSSTSADGNVDGARLVGRLLTEIYPRLAASCDLERLLAVANGAEPIDVEEVPFSGLQGERFLSIHAAQFGANSAVLFIRDITEHHWQSREMLREAFHDQLTGLTNQTLFSRVVSMALANRGRRSDSVALLFIDLDDFKCVNDTYGHAVGDELLRLFAARLSSVLRDGDVVARLGGDEFTVLVTDVSAVEGMASIAERVRNAISGTYRVNAEEIPVTVSIGAALAQPDDTQADALVRRADYAMYQAKRAGRNGYYCYNENPADSVVS